MRSIVVTGANKGIGYAIAKAILKEHDDTFVFLGSRDEARGQEAVATLVSETPTWADRLAVLPIDVASDRSVATARERVAQALGASRLYAVVNNAGIGSGTVAAVLAVNTFGVKRACDAFIPMLATGGRVVNVTSAAGPNFVATCSAPMQRFFLDAATPWAALERLMSDCIAMEGDKAAFAARGLGDGAAYGLSKACTNLYTLALAKEHPELRVNACTPGFIETDLTRKYAATQGKSPAELGMKPPAEGARSTMFLLFGEPEANGRYYGSDALRSPLDRYRAPGSPAYLGD